MTLEELAKKLALLKQLKEYHETCAKILGSDIANISSQIFDAFMSSQTTQIRLSGKLFKDKEDRTVKPTLKYKPTIILQDTFFSWMQANKHGILIKEQIHPKALEGFVTAQKKNNKILPTEDVLKVFTIQTASIRKVSTPETSVTDAEGE